MILSQPSPDAVWVGFDEERQLDLYDSDNDSFPDLTEQMAGTDVLDPGSSPSIPTEFPTASCRAGYIQAGARLCISSTVKGSTSFASANSACRSALGRVCSYDDLSYLYLNTSLDATYNAGNGTWLGDTSTDDGVLCGNRTITSDNDPDIYNFDGICNRAGSHPYWCCHDDET